MQLIRRHPASRGTRRLAAIAAAAVAVSFAATGLTATASYADSGVISGTITFPAGLAPATDGGVALFQDDPTNGQEFVTSTTANADGSYEFAGFADGTYYVLFGYGAQEAVTESYGGTSDLATTG